MKSVSPENNGAGYVLELSDGAHDSFDAIVLDPPKFAHSAEQVTRATRGYKDINLLAFKLLRPGGLLMVEGHNQTAAAKTELAKPLAAACASAPKKLTVPGIGQADF